MTGSWVLLAAVLLAVTVGLAVRARQGRVRNRRGSPTSPLPDQVRALINNSGITLVQISTQFCAPCRHARIKLAELAAHTDGVGHVELDVTEKPDLARELRVLATPTTIAFDRHGVELFRFNGLPGTAVVEQVASHVP